MSLNYQHASLGQMMINFIFVVLLLLVIGFLLNGGLAYAKALPDSCFKFKCASYPS